MIISLEGLDNSGKTTQLECIDKELSRMGYKVVVSRELTTEVGSILKRSFSGIQYSPQMKTLLFAADRQERLEKLSDNLKGSIVIFDRYIHSALAYRLSDGIEENWIRNVNKNVPPIDIGFYIDISGEESIKRNNSTKKNITYSREQLNSIRKNYKKFVKRGELIQIDGLKEINDICKDIIEAIIARINKMDYDI